jgi:hypothetical protein
MSQLKKPSNPSFCIITPATAPYLTEFASRSKTHLVLAHIARRNSQYCEFYKERAAAGDFVIMDNGAFELGESYNPADLVKIGKKCGAHALVLPDYPFKPADVTIKAAIEWIPFFKSEGFLTFFVPQSERGNWKDWAPAYGWAANNPDIDIIGMSILGIPNALPHIPPAYGRVVATELLIQQGIFAKDKYHHYLGLNAGPALEIPALLARNALDSCDSSNPVWMGVLGHQYSTNTDSYLPVKKAKLEVDFNHQHLDDATKARIHYNIDLTLSLFKE